MATPLRVPEDEVVWCAAAPGAPEFDLHETASGLRLEVVPAVGAGGPTSAALCAWSLDRAGIAVYGGSVLPALLVVAVDLRSGRTFARSPAHPREVVDLALDAAPATDGPVAASGQLNVDLPGLLALPRRRRRYAAFLWLDRLVSDVRTFEVEGPEPRPWEVAEEDDDLVQEAPEDPIRFADPAAPPPGAPAVTLAAPPAPVDALPGLALAGALRTGDPTGPLVVLARAYRARTFHAAIQRLPERVRAAQGGAFVVEPARAFGLGDLPAREQLLLLALHGGLRSELAAVTLGR